MSHDEPEPMDPAMAALLAIKKPVPTPPDDVRERVFAHVLGHIVPPPMGAGGGGGGAGAADARAPLAARDAAASTGTAIARALAQRPVAWLFATFAAGALVGGATLGVSRGERTVYVDRPVPAASAPLATQPWNLVPQPAPIAAIAAPPEAPAVSPPRATKPVPSTALDSQQMAAERTLLDVARAALSRGEAASALDVVARYAAEFPNGKLVEEREVITIRALVQVGKVDEARERAARFHARFPDSISGRAVDSAIRSIP